MFVIPDSKIHEANMGPIWARQGPGGPYVGPMNFAIWDVFAAEESRHELYYVVNFSRENCNFPQI